MSSKPQARVRQQLQRTLRELRLERCSHLAAVPAGTTEARRLAAAWLYATPYRCPDCGLHFTERHAQPAERNAVD